MYHSVSLSKHLQGYLNEYAWRYNQRYEGAGRFQHYFFGPRRFDVFSGVAAFFRLLKKSPRFGTGMSSPGWVF